MFDDTRPQPYNHDGATLTRLTANGDYTPIGYMVDDDIASYAAAALNAVAHAGRADDDGR